MTFPSVVRRVTGKIDSQRAGSGVRRRAATYGGLTFALLFLGMQVAPPRMPMASAATRHDDATALLPPLPAPVAAAAEPAATEALFEITLPYPKDGNLAALLVQAGAEKDEAKQAVELLGEHVDEDSDIKLALGEAGKGKDRPIERLTILSDLGRTIIVRDGETLRVARGEPDVRHLSIDLGKDAFSSLRGAGLDARLALEAAVLIDKRAAGARRVSAVIGERPDRFEAKGVPQLLYLAVTREGRPALRLLRWPGAPDGWIDADRFTSETGFMQPVRGRVSSGFGARFHPILRFLRPHQGVDFAAAWGEPVRAAADGRVVDAGWHGGYGRQVRLDHGNAVVTSYSHLSDMVVAPGSQVRRGQIIGYVGASGLATGPHLHFEVARLGRRIDPLRARMIDATSAANRSAVAARLAQLKVGA